MDWKSDPYEEDDLDPSCTDMANADRYIERHGRRFLYCPAVRSWFAWKDGRYERDVRGEAQFAAREVAEVIFGEAAGCEDARRAERLRRFAQYALSSSGQDALLEMVTSDPRIVVNLDDFDVDRWVIHLPSGLLDLRTREMTDHEASDPPLVSKIAGACYDPKAECPRWQRMLGEAFGEEAAFVQRAVGYSLTGEVNEVRLFLLHGEDPSGFLETLMRMMGDYALALPQDPDRLGEIEETELMGRRLIIASQTQPIDEERFSLWNRLAYGRLGPLNLRPMHKLWLATERSIRPGGALEKRRRVRCIGLRAPIWETPPKYEMPGVLNWALRGLEAWLDRGHDVKGGGS